jgi:iron complex outermembrane receptor protein
MNVQLRRVRRLQTTLLVWVLTRAVAAETAVAQQTDTAATPPTPVLEEVVVSSRRREEVLQRVPEAIVAISESEIDSRKIQNMSDVLSVTPNVSIVSAQDPGLAMVNIRGISQVRNGEPPVAFVIDGVQLLSSDSFSQDLYDIQRIEILKGPQGAYYGRNAMGGALVVTTKAPTNDFEGFIRAGYGNGDDTLVQGALRGPLIQDRLLFSLSASDDSYGGLIESATLKENGRPKRLDWKDDRNVRGRLIGDLTERLTVDVRGGYSKLDAGASYYIATDNPNDRTTPEQADEAGYSTRLTKDGAVKIDYDFAFAKLTSTTSYSDVSVFLHEDLDWLPASILGAEQARRTKGTAEEVRLTSPSEQRLRWMVGGYGLWQDRMVNTTVLITADPTVPLGLHAPVTATTEIGRDTAFFGQANYDIIEGLELTGALRWDRETREQFDHLTGRVVSDAWPKVQPKVSLAYRWTPDVLLYTTYGVGFRSGGFNSPGTVFPPSYKAQTATSYEAGVKSAVLDGRVRLNGAVFYTQEDNFQVFALSEALQGLFNVAKSHVAGAELEAVGQVTDGLRLDFGLGYTYSRIDRYEPTGAGFETSIPVVPSQIVGNSLPLTYRWSTSAGAEYRRSFQLARNTWNGILRIDYSGRSGNYWAIDNLAEEDTRALFAASLRFDDGHTSVAFWGKNLTNQNYTEEFFPKQWCCTFTGIRWPGQPRRFGVTVTRHF